MGPSNPAEEADNLAGADKSRDYGRMGKTRFPVFIRQGNAPVEGRFELDAHVSGPACTAYLFALGTIRSYSRV